MSPNLSLHARMLCHARACCRQSSGISTRSFVVGVRKRKDPSPFIAFYPKSSSFSTVKICNWNHSLSSTLSPSLRWPRMAPGRSLSNPAGGDIIRTLGNNASKPKLPTTSDPPSFFQNLYNEIHLLLQSLHELFVIDIPILFPRLIAFAGTLHLTSEYGFKTFQCEGPSMEPTIIDGSYTSVVIDRWSHRLFGLEKDVGPADESKIAEGKGQNNHHEESDNSANSWYALLSGIWEQHFASGLQRGDVIILNHPIKKATICKRIIGMPGDTIVRTDGGCTETNRRVVPPGHLWIEGDNALQSLDSRSYGTVPASLVIGKVICRLWPLREYVSLGMDANGIEHWRRVIARIGRGERPLPLDGNRIERFNGSYLLANERGEKNR